MAILTIRLLWVVTALLLHDEKPVLWNIARNSEIEESYFKTQYLKK